MSEISIKIKGPISKVRNTKTKKKAKAKPKTKTETYLEKLKGAEYSYNVSPFYDYKTSLQPTYIYRQQTIPQLQQDSKHNELIKYLEDLKKSDRELQTLKFRNTDPPPVQYFPEHLLNQPKQEPKQEDEEKDEEEDEDETKTTSGTKVDEVVEVKDIDRYHQLEKEIEKKKKKIKTEETKYNNAIDREIQRAKENKPLVYESKQEKSSNQFLEGINILKTEIAVKELEKNILKRNLGIK